MNEHSRPDNIANAYASSRFVYLDIETIPCQSPDYLAELQKGIRPPGNIKKPESIAAWLAENRETAAVEALAKTSFDGGRGHVCTIAWAKNDGPVFVAHAETVDDERAVLQSFFSALDAYHAEILVGHNVAGFDLPFLRKRAIVLGLEIPHGLPRDPKPWDKSINDTMSMWAGGRDFISMDALCGILGIPGKDGFDGSMVAQAWADGKHSTIAEYCEDDVWRTREIHKRFLAAGW